MTVTRIPANALNRLIRLKNKLKLAIQKRMIRMVSLNSRSGSMPLQHFPTKVVHTEDCVSMPFKPLAHHLKQTRYTIAAGTSRILKGVYYAPNNMLLTRSRRIIAEASSTEREPNAFQWHHLFRLDKEHIEGCCTSIRSLRNNYYHSIVDNLPRLFLLHHDTYANQKIKLLFPGGPTPVESFFLDKLCPPNVTIIATDPSKLYSCDEFLFVDFISQRFAAYLPLQYLDFFHQKTLPKRPRCKNKKIIISRKKAVNARNILNEEELAEALLPLGYQSYILEDMSLPEQIELFYDAQAVVSPHGAGLTNLLYAHEVDVIELHPNKGLFPHYYFMCESLQHRYQYWCGTAEKRFSPFQVNVSEILKLLA